jgi:hypothetical protein
LESSLGCVGLTDQAGLTPHGGTVAGHFCLFAAMPIAYIVGAGILFFLVAVTVIAAMILQK